jgi:hypothetical protein
MKAAWKLLESADLSGAAAILMLVIGFSFSRAAEAASLGVEKRV